jgi:hypothetical protein
MRWWLLTVCWAGWQGDGEDNVMRAIMIDKLVLNISVGESGDRFSHSCPLSVLSSLSLSSLAPTRSLSLSRSRSLSISIFRSHSLSLSLSLPLSPSLSLSLPFPLLTRER